MFALRSAVFDCVLPGFETADVPHGLLCSYELGSRVRAAAKLESNPGCLLELRDRFQVHISYISRKEFAGWTAGSSSPERLSAPAPPLSGRPRPLHLLNTGFSKTQSQRRTTYGASPPLARRPSVRSHADQASANDPQLARRIRGSRAGTPYPRLARRIRR